MTFCLVFCASFLREVGYVHRGDCQSLGGGFGKSFWVIGLWGLPMAKERICMFLLHSIYLSCIWVWNWRCVRWGCQVIVWACFCLLSRLGLGVVWIGGGRREGEGGGLVDGKRAMDYRRAWSIILDTVDTWMTNILEVLCTYMVQTSMWLDLKFTYKINKLKLSKFE